MSDDSEYRNEGQIRPKGVATISLLVVNGIVWLFQYSAYRHNLSNPIDERFALSLEGLKHGYVWQLLTFQFMHAVPEPWHILLNSWAIYMFGRVVETTLGAWRMLTLYFVSGIVGGLVQMLGSWLLPGLFGDASVVGASAGAFGLVGAFAVLYPNQRLYLLLFLVIPIRMKATTLLWFSIALAVFGILLPYFAKYLPPSLGIAQLFGSMAHAAHLGGIVTGFLGALWIVRAYQRPPVIAPAVKSSLHITPARD